MSSNKVGVFWNKTRLSFMQLTIGGDWALALPDAAKRNLRWYWFDGFLAAASDNILLTYLSVYMLALGATQSQVGLMSSLSSLSAALLLLPGAYLVERYGHRKQLTVVIGGGISRLMVLLLAVAPFFIEAPAVVWAAILIAVAREAFANLAFPGWMSITGDIVPINGRGRYFGSRNFVMAIAGIFTTLLIGEMITRSGSPIGFQVALLIAFMFGMLSTFSFGHIEDPKGNAAIASNSSISLWSIWGDLRVQRMILALFATTAIWNFSLNIAGPFFTVYLVQNLHATATMVGLTSIATSVASMLVQRKVGVLADRWGPRRVQLISMMLIPILPACWLFITEPWQAIPINLLGGVLWGTYSLASFNFVLALFPDSLRARYSAMYQIVVTLALAGGAAIGSVIIAKIGFYGVFLLSAVGRFIASLLFAKFVRPTKPDYQPALPGNVAQAA